MTYRASTLAIAALVASLSAHATPEAGYPLDWMSGCWKQQTGDTKEVWSASEGGLMFGYSVSVKDGKAGFFEDLRIDQRGDKALYIASPNGKSPTAFTETERTGATIVFENAEHDYPQRIEYGANRVALVAKISKLDGSEARLFAMGRCEEIESEAPEPTGEP
ncbi:DUF6265 family protein [Henriciella sp.]|uniref:DUF6265 family protein n=1 Tax=Henriciella sp. TaxID=1968823 RepID=UPI002616E5CE|nr:DUF6265 family protein [Henriciella sp.]